MFQALTEIVKMEDCKVLELEDNVLVLGHFYVAVVLLHLLSDGKLGWVELGCHALY